MLDTTPCGKTFSERLSGLSLLERYLALKLREYRERYPDSQDVGHCWRYLTEGVNRCVLDRDWGKY